MIKVSFFCQNSAYDVCGLLEKNFTDNMDIEDWLIKKIPSLKFECMDFPYDMENYYDCYFTSSSQETDAIAVYHFLKGGTVDFSVSIVDDELNFIKEITER